MRLSRNLQIAELSACYLFFNSNSHLDIDNSVVASPTRVNLKDNELTLERFQTLYLDIFL